MCADHSDDENPTQVCVLVYTFLACTHICHMTEPVPTRRYLLSLLITCCTSTSCIKNTPLPRSTFHPHPPNLPLPPNATETGIQTHPTSFPSRRLLILRCHYPQVTVRARARYRRHSSRHISLCCPSRWVHKSQTTLQPSNSSTGTLTSCQARERHRKRQFRFE